MVKTVDQVIVKKLKDEFNKIRQLKFGHNIYYDISLIENQLRDLYSIRSVYDIAYTKADSFDKFKSYSFELIIDLLIEHYQYIKRFLNVFELYKDDFKQKNPNGLIPKTINDIEFKWENGLPIQVQLQEMWTSLEQRHVNLKMRLISYESILDIHFDEIEDEFGDDDE